MALTTFQQLRDLTARINRYRHEYHDLKAPSVTDLGLGRPDRIREDHRDPYGGFAYLENRLSLGKRPDTGGSHHSVPLPKGDCPD